MFLWSTHGPRLTLPLRLGMSLQYAGLSASHVAEAIGTTGERVGEWLQGLGRPSAADLARWAQLTGTPLSWLDTGRVTETALSRTAEQA